MSTSRKILVAAIDIGTTHSGLAFSYVHEYERDPLRAITNVWKDRVNLHRPTTSTCILFNKKKLFHSFGYEAEDKYLELTEAEEHQEWYFFKNFKTSLYNKKEQLSKAATTYTIDGKEMVAIDVFSAAIKFFSSHLQDALDKQGTGVRETDIQWVLIVSTIWDDAAKQFMREAAEKAGISGDQILLVPDTEAGFVYCMNENIQMHRKNCSSIGFEAGTKCMVVIAENDRVEIAVYDVQHKGMLKKLFSSADICDWGGNKVVDALCSLLTDIFGDAVMKLFISEYEKDFRECLNDFGDRKIRNIRPSSDTLTIPIPYYLSKIFSTMNPECNIETRMSLSPKYKNKIRFQANKLRIDATLLKALFDESCSKIIFHMQELFLYPTLKDVSSIILVGRYAKSPMLEFALKEAFQDPHREVFVPKDAEVANLKGAVIYGHQLQQNLKFKE